MASIVLYVGFAAAVFLIHGTRPLLSPDHLSYIRLADSIMRGNCFQLRVTRGNPRYRFLYISKS